MGEAMRSAQLLAHQGGWDELLLVAAPIVIFVVLLKIANARALRLEAAMSSQNSEPDEDHHPPDSGGRTVEGTG